MDILEKIALRLRRSWLLLLPSTPSESPEERYSIISRMLRTIDGYPSSLGSHQWQTSGRHHSWATLSRYVGGKMYLHEALAEPSLVCGGAIPANYGIVTYPKLSIRASFRRHHIIFLRSLGKNSMAMLSEA